MKCLTPEQVAAWWESHFLFTKLPIDLREWPSESTTRFWRNTELLPAMRIRYFSQSIVKWLVEGDPAAVMVWVQDYGIWGSEDWNLYQIFREARSGRSYLEDGPGHLLLLHEREDAATLIFMALAFGWDTVAAASDGLHAMSFNHDGHFSVWTDDATSRNCLVEALMPEDNGPTAPAGRGL